MINAEIDRRDAERRGDEVWCRFAAAALGGMLANLAMDSTDRESVAASYANAAGLFADALMVERAKRRAGK